MRDRLIDILQRKPYGHSTYEEFADYLLENGVVVPPCKVEQTVYIPNFSDKKVHKYRVNEINIGAGNNNVVVLDLYIYDYIVPRSIAIYFDQFGKTVFLTREEAEQALKGGVENDK